MNKFLRTILICLAWQHVMVAMEHVSKLENLNVLSIRPAMNCIEHRRRTIDEVCIAIQNGHNAQNNNTYVVMEQGAAKKIQLLQLSTELPSDYPGTIALYVSGYAGMSGNARYKYAGNGAYSTFNYLKAGLIPLHAVCISFDGHVNDRVHFNFGQELDQDCLNTMYEAIVKRNCKARIVLVGACKGATTILNYLTNPKNKDKDFSRIKAVLLESPSISFEQVTSQVANKYLYGYGRPLSYLFQFVFPNYTWNQPTMLDSAANFPRHIQALIGCLRQDKIANYEDVLAIVRCFKDAGKNVEVFESQNRELPHGHLSKAEDFQKKLRSYNLYLGQTE